MTPRKKPSFAQTRANEGFGFPGDYGFGIGLQQSVKETGKRFI